MLQLFVGNTKLSQFLAIIDNIGENIWRQIMITASIIWPEIYFKRIRRRGEKTKHWEWAQIIIVCVFLIHGRI